MAVAPTAPDLDVPNYPLTPLLVETWDAANESPAAGAWGFDSTDRGGTNSYEKVESQR